MRNGPYTLVIAPSDYPGKKYRGRYCYEHHLVWWRKRGSLPLRGFVIHHKDGNHTNNSIGNLELLSVEDHNTHHATENLNPFHFNCDNCGSTHFIARRTLIDKIKNEGQKYFFCSRVCGARFQHKLGGKLR